jgi:hypothetical protein
MTYMKRAASKGAFFMSHWACSTKRAISMGCSDVQAIAAATRDVNRDIEGGKSAGVGAYTLDGASYSGFLYSNGIYSTIKPPG